MNVCAGSFEHLKSDDFLGDYFSKMGGDTPFLLFIKG